MQNRLLRPIPNRTLYVVFVRNPTSAGGVSNWILLSTVVHFSFSTLATTILALLSKPSATFFSKRFGFGLVHLINEAHCYFLFGVSGTLLSPSSSFLNLRQSVSGLLVLMYKRISPDTSLIYLSQVHRIATQFPPVWTLVCAVSDFFVVGVKSLLFGDDGFECQYFVR